MNHGFTCVFVFVCRTVVIRVSTLQPVPLYDKSRATTSVLTVILTVSICTHTYTHAPHTHARHVCADCDSNSEYLLAYIHTCTTHSVMYILLRTLFCFRPRLGEFKPRCFSVHRVLGRAPQPGHAHLSGALPRPRRMAVSTTTNSFVTSFSPCLLSFLHSFIHSFTGPFLLSFVLFFTHSFN